jgi:hypothetical protein
MLWRMLRGHLTAAPRRLAPDAREGDEREPHAVWVLEREHALTEALPYGLVRDAFLK